MELILKVAHSFRYSNLLLLIAVAGVLLVLWRLKPDQRALGAIAGGILLQCGAGALAYFGSLDIYGYIDHFVMIRLLAWVVFFYDLLYLGGVFALTLSHTRWLAIPTGLLAAAILLVGVDAFLIEPQWLEISRVKIRSDKVSAPVRIAVIADIQTDDPGSYESAMLEKVKAEQPDLILLAGDYLMMEDNRQYPQGIQRLHDIFQQANLKAPLGVYVVRGNIDSETRFDAIFDGLPVTLLSATTRIDLGPIVFTGLSLDDSFSTHLIVKGEEKFHVVMGHAPNFSLGQVEADLILAGHTHGGQVRVPFIGPLFTLSEIPRAWAAGVTQIAPGKTLIVSRGVGMERHLAPRMRFNCRPEVVIVEVEPGK